MKPRPATLVAAVALLLVGVAVSLPVALPGVANIPVQDDAVGSPAMLVGYFITVAIQLLFIYLIFSGHNRARYVYVVLLVWGIIISVDGPVPETIYHQSAVINHWLQTALGLVAVFLLLLPSTSIGLREIKSLNQSSEPE